MKAFTDIKQSAQLALLLPKESADMWWNWFSDPFDEVNGGEYTTEPLLHKPVCNPEKTIPCWSLAALFNYLHKIGFFPEIEVDESAVTMNISYYDDEEAELLSLAPVHNIKVKAEDFIDACYEMIMKLHEEKLL